MAWYVNERYTRITTKCSDNVFENVEAVKKVAISLLKLIQVQIKELKDVPEDKYIGNKFQKNEVLE